MKYGNIRGDAPHDKNDCAVVTTAVLTGIPYSEASAKLTAAGRIRHHRTSRNLYEGVIREMGFTIREITSAIHSKTIRTIERELAAGWGGCKIMINVRGHVLAWNGNKIVDWSAGRGQRIRQVHHVYPNGVEPVGRSVPQPKQIAKLPTGRKRSAVIVTCEAHGIYHQKYRSVKAAYEAIGLDLRKHQKVRLYVKRHGSANYRAWSLDHDEAVQVQMKLAE